MYRMLFSTDHAYRCHQPWLFFILAINDHISDTSACGHMFWVFPILVFPKCPKRIHTVSYWMKKGTICLRRATCICAILESSRFRNHARQDYMKITSIEIFMLPHRQIELLLIFFSHQFCSTFWCFIWECPLLLYMLFAINQKCTR